MCDAAGEALAPDEVAFSILLQGFGAADPPNWKKIRQWLVKMENRSGVMPTAGTKALSSCNTPFYCYHTSLKSTVNVGCFNEAVLNVLKCCLWCLVIYNTLLEICSRTNDLEMAETFVEEMASRRIEPNSFTDTIVSRRRSMRGLLRRLKLFLNEEYEDPLTFEDAASTINS